VTIAEPVIQTVVSEYTREAGVRQLERELGKILRKTATRIASKSVEPPVARRSRRRPRRARPPEVLPGGGRAHCGAGCRNRARGDGGAGGDVLFVRGEPRWTATPDLTLTGQLGDVMKESARIALSYIRSHSEELGIEGDAFKDRMFHVHVPAGAIPKDGPSAGITMANRAPRRSSRSGP